MIIAARIDLVEQSAEIHESEARTLRLLFAAPPAHADWPAGASSTQAEHDRMILVAGQLRRMATEMRAELDQMTEIGGASALARAG